MAASSPLQLSLLTLSPIPLADLPSPKTDPEAFKTFAKDLTSEAHAILNHPEWAEPKEWHNSKVLTRTLRDGAVVHLPRKSDAATAAVSTEKKVEKKRSFWGGGGDKSEKEKEKERDGAIQWHSRTTYHPISQGEGNDGGFQTFGYEVYWETLGEKHVEKELEYVQSLSKIAEVEPETGVFLKMYSLPFPTTNRSFLSYVLVQDTTTAPTSSESESESSPPLRSFIVFSLPITEPPSTNITGIDKGYVRGRYVAVEEVSEVYVDKDGKEVESGELGDKVIRWRCASMSDAGGSIPIRIAEGAMPSSLASHVPSFYAWLAKRYDGKPHPDAASVKHWYNINGVSVPGLKRSASLKGVSH